MIKKLRLSEIWMAAVENSYSILNKMGKGSFGTVVSAYCHQTKQTVAIKHINNFEKHEYTCLKVLREIQIMRRLTDMVKDTQLQQFSPQLYDIFSPEIK